MLDWLINVVFSALVIGCMTYMVVWGMHNFELTLDTIMAWADQQETFLQKLISCPVCFGTQVAIALSALHCIVFHVGLWSWVTISLSSCLVALILIRKLDPLTESEK